MDVSVTDAKAQLTELVRRAEEGEDIVLTRHGRPAVRLVPAVTRRPTEAQKRALMEEIRDSAPKNYSGPSAARSQDFLYDDDGLPG